MRRPSFFPVLIGTGFGSGFSPFAPGTAGALLATLIWFGLSLLISETCLLWTTVALISLFTVAGIWATDRLEPYWGEDPSRVVVDEMVGVWITLLAAPAGHIWYGLAAFVLFRFFDILKPRSGSDDGRRIGRSVWFHCFNCGEMVDGVEEQSRFAGWRREVWLFMKAQLSAQIATVIDFLITILLVKLFGIYYLYATFIGSVVGGIVNCVINYEWVFKAEDCKKIHVGLKYFIVWGGSILINTWGTFALTEWLAGMKWVNGLLGYYVYDVFILSKITVALLVAFFWNYYLQRVFVYRNHNLKRFLKQRLEKKIE